ncbi:tyrosine-type recombinase/integrase [Paenibacillus terrae]|uniref:tyrosine-type recombinase/integrase n=1 Tax=Paenibacillus terrae TaxID=159743 RepID=UPI0002E82F9A|nr:tyrosine-type recombinase/integrase [Paenibacillus terrae]
MSIGQVLDIQGLFCFGSISLPQLLEIFADISRWIHYNDPINSTVILYSWQTYILKLREPKTDKRIPKFLIEEDVILLKISCESPREYAILEFLYSTGCRVGEVQKHDIEDINLEDCSAIVNGKGAKQREIYFTTECKIWIKRYLESRDDSCTALFVTETQPARRMSIPTIRHSLKKLASLTNVAVNVYPHRFRHTYACQLLDNGAPLEFIQGMLGHEKASTTQIYAQLRGERRRELYRRYI